MVSDEREAARIRNAVLGLNPCSNGIWSLTHYAEEKKSAGKGVLILVLMEYGL